MSQKKRIGPPVKGYKKGDHAGNMAIAAAGKVESTPARLLAIAFLHLDQNLHAFQMPAETETAPWSDPSREISKWHCEAGSMAFNDFIVPKSEALRSSIPDRMMEHISRILISELYRGFQSGDGSFFAEIGNAISGTKSSMPVADNPVADPVQFWVSAMAWRNQGKPFKCSETDLRREMEQMTGLKISSGSFSNTCRKLGVKFSNKSDLEKKTGG